MAMYNPHYGYRFVYKGIKILHGHLYSSGELLFIRSPVTFLLVVFHDIFLSRNAFKLLKLVLNVVTGIHYYWIDIYQCS